MSFPIEHMAGINDMFPKNASYDWFKGEGNIVRMYGVNSKHALVKQVFHTFMKKALEDMIEEKSILQLPLFQASIYIEEVPTEVVERKRAQGKFMDYSMFFAQGVYAPIYRYKKRAMFMKCRMFIGEIMYQRMVELINKGAQYYGNVTAW